MSAPKHTLAVVGPASIGDETGAAIFKPVSHEPDRRSLAHRLVDCWNACEGIEDPAEFIDRAKRLLELPPYAVARCSSHRSRLPCALCESFGRTEPDHGPHSSGGALAVQDVHEASKGEKCSGQHAHCLGCDALRVKRGKPIAPKGACT